MRCPQCGHLNVSSAERCAACDAPIPAADTPVQPGATFRDPDDLSFPAEPGPARAKARAPIRAPAALTGAPADEPPAPHADEPRFLDERRPPRLESGVPMRDIAARLRPDARRTAATQPVRYAGFIRRAIAFAIDLVVLALFTVPLATAGLAGIRIALTVADLPQPFAMDDSFASLLGFGGALDVRRLLHRAAHGVGPDDRQGRRSASACDRATCGRSARFAAWSATIAYAASSAVFGLGFLIIAFTPHKRGWHDYVAGTCVVRLRPEEV